MKTRNIFHRSHVYISFIAVIYSIVILVTIKGLLDIVSLLNPMSRAFGNFNMTDLFCEIENGATPYDTSRVITIVDMSEVYDRAKLADIIKEIDTLSPAIVGVDVRFDGIRDDIMGNKRLIETVCNTTSPIIWACKLSEWSNEEGQFTNILHSFFVDLGVNVEEGFTNVQAGTNGVTVRSYGVQRQAMGKTRYSMPARLAVGMTGDSTVMEKTDYSIRYSATHFPIVPYDSIPQNTDLIRNHIVILGAMNDERDMHYTPLGLTPGVLIMSYAVNTVIAGSAPRELPVVLMVLVVFFFLWLGEVLFVCFRRKTDKIPYLGAITREGILDGIYTMLFMTTILILMDYSIFRLTGYYFDTAFVVASICSLGTARAIYKLIENKNKEKQ